MRTLAKYDHKDDAYDSPVDVQMTIMGLGKGTGEDGTLKLDIGQ